MHLKERQIKKPPSWSVKSFPWRCYHCAKDQVYLACVRYQAEIPHDGHVHKFTIPQVDIPVCRACGEKVFTNQVDDQINAAMRSHLHLLTPDEIRAAIERVELTPEQVAERLGIDEATISAWLNETQIQSRSMDNLLRIFFAFPPVRAALVGESQDPLLGMVDVLSRT